uniref:GPI-anchored protein LLG1-like domain-containing protein n=2 Tax=Rhizophora mucronata TaxID=61149 RepID=A0A2P2JUZ9_RHIMU
MMQWNRCFTVLSLLLLLSLFLPSSFASAFISDNVDHSHASAGRNLLQAKKACPVNFEFLNYTIITSKCKGPNYPPDLCCSTFKDFACPYADVINDLSNDCASTMFSYINLYGKYPPGLFASFCKEGKEGLACPPTPSQSADSSGSQITCNPSRLLIPAVGFLVVLFKLF